MAKIQEEVLIIKISTMLPDQATVTPVMTPDMIGSVEAVLQQLAAESGQAHVLVEVQQA